MELGSGNGGGGGGDGVVTVRRMKMMRMVTAGMLKVVAVITRQQQHVRAANYYYVPHTTVSSLPRQLSLIRTTLEAKNGELKQEKLSNLTVGGRVETHAIRLQNLLS